MGKKKFLIRSSIVAIGSLLSITIVFYARYSKYPLKSLAIIHVSNSLCYNSNVQNLAANNRLDKIECMVFGSSISLNNLSAKMIEDTIGVKTYNLSSWGFPVMKAIDFFAIARPARCRRVLIAFNNIDFAGNHPIQYDFSLSRRYMEGNGLVKLMVILKTFNFLQFDNDTKYKDSTIHSSALDFDSYGSALLDPVRFPRNDEKIPVYKDTLGFYRFYTDMVRLKNFLKKNSCNLTLVYAPYRKNVLSKGQLLNCDEVALQLQSGFGNNFIDLHREPIADSLFWDGAHLYKDGADHLTRLMLKVIKAQRSI